MTVSVKEGTKVLWLLCPVRGPPSSTSAPIVQICGHAVIILKMQTKGRGSRIDPKKLWTYLMEALSVKKRVKCDDGDVGWPQTRSLIVIKN